MLPIETKALTKVTTANIINSDHISPVSDDVKGCSLSSKRGTFLRNSTEAMDAFTTTTVVKKVVQINAAVVTSSIVVMCIIKEMVSGGY